MIHDVDESLRALVRRDALNGSPVEIAFDAPTKEWVARRNAPTVDLYLYDIREDLPRREVAWENVRDATGRVVERRPPPRRFRLSYLVTAWTQRPEDEHRLLSAMLSCFIRHEAMPREVIAGPLAEQTLPVYITVALPPPEDRSFADVWTALGGELKPSLDLVVTAPLDTRRTEVAGPPVLEEPRLSVVDSNGTSRAGKGTAGGAAAGGAPGRATRASRARGSDAESRSAEGTETGGEAGDADREVTQDETRTAGSKKQPGRVIRVQGLGCPTHGSR